MYACEIGHHWFRWGLAVHLTQIHYLNSLWSVGTIQHCRSGSILDQMMGWACLTTIHFLNQCWHWNESIKYLWKYIWKCCLQSDEHFVQASVSSSIQFSSLVRICTGDFTYNPNSKVHGANMGPFWGRQDPGEPHIGSMNFAIWEDRAPG